MLNKEKSSELAQQLRITLAQVLAHPVDEVEVTCETCLDNDNCEWAWDLYNTNGDCLAIK